MKNKKIDYKLTSQIIEMCANHLYSLECYDDFPGRETEVTECIDMVIHTLKVLSEEMDKESKKCHT